MNRFLEWIGLKEKIHQINFPPIFQEGELWWVNLGENVGHEENGKGKAFSRPFVVIRKFNKELLFGIPCSSVMKENKYYFEINIRSLEFRTSALLSQARVLSSRRLARKIDKMGSGAFRKLKMALNKAIFN